MATPTPTLEVDIIVGRSFFTDVPIVGVAITGDTDCVRAYKAAEAAARGNRPAAIEPCRGRPQAETVAYIIARWRDWANRYGVALTINPDPRKVSKPF